MSPMRDGLKRWRPRYSIRSLMLIAMLPAVYLGCWDLTKRHGVHDVQAYSSKLQGVPLDFSGLDIPPPCVAPLLVANDELRRESDELRRCYYIWLFGPVVKLPPERVLHRYAPNCIFESLLQP